MAEYKEMPKSKDGIGGVSEYERQMINRNYQRNESEYFRTAPNAIDRSKGASEALRKYENAKRDYEKASIIGKAFLKLTGQANFKKMLEEANSRSR